jgi:hypothetical protein
LFLILDAVPGPEQILASWLWQINWALRSSGSGVPADVQADSMQKNKTMVKRIDVTGPLPHCLQRAPL